MFQKWIPLLVLLEFKLCCNFLPLGQKRGECWVWLFSFEEGGLNAVFFNFIFYFFYYWFLFVLFLCFFWHTSRKDCQPSFVQKKNKKRKKKSRRCPSEALLHFSTLRKLLSLGFIWRRDGVTAVQSSIMYKLLYSVFNRSSVKSKIFCIYCTTFYTNFFFKHQCSNLSPSLPRKRASEKEKIWGVLCNMPVAFFFFKTFGVMIPHSVTAAAHRPVSWLTVTGV